MPNDGEMNRPPEHLESLRMATAEWLDGRRVRLFASWGSAVEHLARHLLSEPEALAWRLIAPELDEIESAPSHGRREHLLRAAMETRGATLQEVYDSYAMVVQRGLDDALRLGWVVTSGSTSAFLSLDGLVGIVESQASSVVLTTAFLAGQTTVSAIERGRSDDRGRPWRDCPRPLRAQLRELRDSRSADETSRRAHREASWSNDQRVYHFVFQPAVQALRAMQFDQVRRRNHAARLKEKLPPLSRLRFEHWRSLREATRGTQSAERQ